VFFFKEKFIVITPSNLIYSYSVGSPEEETLKSTGSSIINDILPEAEETTVVLSGTYKA
jgi:hypothetical protein